MVKTGFPDHSVQQLICSWSCKFFIVAEFSFCFNSKISRFGNDYLHGCLVVLPKHWKMDGKDKVFRTTTSFDSEYLWGKYRAFRGFTDHFHGPVVHLHGAPKMKPSERNDQTCLLTRRYADERTVEHRHAEADFKLRTVMRNYWSLRKKIASSCA